MKSELWPKVRVGSWVIYCDEYDGVFRAKVAEIDIRVYDPSVPGSYGYPYGKTAETGVVKISYDETEKIENLGDLVAYGPAKLAELKAAWNKWQSQKAEAESLREEFLALRNQYKEL